MMIAYVKERMGHSSVKIAVDTDGHLISGANKAAVDRLDVATGRNLCATSNGSDEGPTGEGGVSD